jgi:hypothetical protein
MAGCSDGQRPVVIAVTVVPVVQSPVNETISVIAVRYCLMPAASVVAATTDWGAGRRVRLVHGQYVLIVMVAVNRVEMPVVQIVVVVAMRDAQVATRLTVDMGVVGVSVVICHYTLLSSRELAVRASGKLKLSGNVRA